jgi:hypothetical protein
MVNLFNKQFVGVGVGATIGAWSQDPGNNPWSAITGATIGGLIGSYVTKDIEKEFARFTHKQNTKISNYMKYSFKSISKTNQQRLESVIGQNPQELISRINEGKLTQGNAIKMLNVINTRLGLPNREFTQTDLTNEVLNKIYSTFNEKVNSSSLSSVRELERTAGMYNNNLIETEFKNVPTRWFKTENEQVKKIQLLTDAYKEAGYTEAEAAQRASELVATFGEGKLRVQYSGHGKDAIPQKILVGDKNSMYITHRKMFDVPGENRKVAIGMTMGDSNAVVRGTNPLGMIFNKDDSTFPIHDLENGKFGKKRYPRVSHGLNNEGILGIAESYDPETRIIQEARIRGRSLQQGELTSAIQRIQHAYDHSHTATDHLIRNAGTKIDYGKPIKIDSKTGEISNISLQKNADKNIEKSLTSTYGWSPTRGVSTNHSGLYSDGRIKYRSVDVTLSGEHNPIVTHIRDTLATNPDNLMSMFRGTDLEYLSDHANVTTNINVSDELANLIANKYGSQYSIDDGAAIAFAEVNGKAPYDNYIERSATLAYLKEDKSKVVHHWFTDKDGNNLLTDNFFKSSIEEKLGILGQNDKGEFKHNVVLGLDENLVQAKLGSYADKGVVKDIVKTENGIKVIYHAQSKPKEWVKIFSQFFKSGDTIASGRTANRIRSLAFLEGSGLISIKDNLISLTSGGKEALKEYGVDSVDQSHFSIDDLFRKKKSTKTIGGLRDLIIDNREQINSIGRLSTFKESKQGIIEDILANRPSKDLDKYLEGFEGSKVLDDNPFLSGAFDVLKDDKRDPINRANAYRFLGLSQLDNRQRTLTIQQMMFNQKRSSVGVNAVMQAAEDFISADKEKRIASHKLLAKTLGVVYKDRIGQSMQKFLFTSETGEEVHAAGKGSKASYLQIRQMRMSGFYEDTLDALFRQNTESRHDINLIMSTEQNGEFNPKDLTKTQVDRFTNAINQAPEDRGALLENIGIKPSNEEYLTYQLSEGIKGYKSIPISLVSTNRTNSNIYGQQLRESLSNIEKLRRNVIEADLIHRGSGQEHTKRHLENTVDALHNSTVSSSKELIKQGFKREARVGVSLTSRSISGSQISSVMKILGDEGDNAIFLSEDIINKMMDTGIENGSGVIGYTPEYIDKAKRFYKVNLEFSDATKEDAGEQTLMGIWNREPSQGPHSSMPVHLIVDTKLHKNAKFAFYAKPEAGTDSLLGILAKHDFDADTPTITSTLGLNQRQYQETQEIGKQLNLHGKRVIGLIKELDPKIRAKPAKTASLLDPVVQANMESILGDAFQKGNERKRSAGIATTINQEITQALSKTSGKDWTKLIDARAVLFAITESTLKNSHLDTLTHSVQGTRYLDALSSMSSKLDKNEITHKQFKEQFRTNIGGLFGLNNKPLGGEHTKMFDDAVELLGNSYAENIAGGNYKDSILGVRRYLMKDNESVTNLFKGIESDPLTRTTNTSELRVGTETKEIKSSTKGVESSIREVASSVKNILKRNKTPLGLGLGALGGLAVLNGAQASELQSKKMPQQPKGPDILPPRKDVKFYSTKVRDTVSNDNSSSYDIRARASNSKASRNNIRKMITGDNNLVRADINFKNSN